MFPLQRKHCQFRSNSISLVAHVMDKHLSIPWFIEQVSQIKQLCKAISLGQREFQFDLQTYYNIVDKEPVYNMERLEIKKLDKHLKYSLVNTPYR